MMPHDPESLPPATPRVVLDLGVPRAFWFAAGLAVLLWGVSTVLRIPAAPSAAQVLREQAVLDAARRIEAASLRAATDTAAAARLDSLLANR